MTDPNDTVFGGSVGIDLNFDAFLGNTSDSKEEVSNESETEEADDFSPHFFHSLLVDDPQEQTNAFKQISKKLKQSLFAKRNGLIRAHLPKLVKLSTDCPFETIRELSSQFLAEITEQLNQLGIIIPEPLPLAFHLPVNSFIPVDTTESEYRKIFRDAFLQTGRVSHLVRILAWHPLYYEKFTAGYNAMMKNSFVLPLHMRNYLAIMASARMKCTYLVLDQEREFRENGGPAEWLSGYYSIPDKLRHLHESNALLAHRPWLLKKEHIEKLMTGSDPWSIPELLHTFILWATFRAMSAVVLALGITPEVDMGVTLKIGKDLFDSDTNPSLGAETAAVIQKLKTKESKDGQAELSSTQKVELFLAAEKNSPEKHATEIKLERKDADVSNLWTESLDERYSDPFQHVRHDDFSVHAASYTIFNVQDFSWETDAYSQIELYLSASTPILLDEIFRTIKNLTYQHFNDAEVADTSPFRMAIWYYVHRVCGIFHDDYDYKQVNNFLTLELKSFIKKMVTQPEKVVLSDLKNLGVSLLPKEKVHVTLLAAEARKQAELLYAIRALVDYTTSL